MDLMKLLELNKDLIGMTEDLIELAKGLIEIAYEGSSKKAAIMEFNHRIRIYPEDRSIGLWCIEGAVKRNLDWEEMKKNQESTENGK